MERRSFSSELLPFILSFSCLLLSFSSSVEAYKNYTVGDSLGWYDISQKPTINYQKWADDKKFSLGDFLIFNTDTNHSVIQTYNYTTYTLCDYDDALDNDTTQWSSGNPSNTETRPVTVAVPLLKEGVSYFFSSDYDGDQCRNGQHFKINVTYGQGLPPSLKTPEDSPSPTSPVAGDDESAPDTVVPSNFNNPTLKLCSIPHKMKNSIKPFVLPPHTHKGQEIANEYKLLLAHTSSPMLLYLSLHNSRRCQVSWRNDKVARFTTKVGKKRKGIVVVAHICKPCSPFNNRLNRVSDQNAIKREETIAQ